MTAQPAAFNIGITNSCMLGIIEAEPRILTHVPGWYLLYSRSYAEHRKAAYMHWSKRIGSLISLHTCRIPKLAAPGTVQAGKYTWRFLSAKARLNISANLQSRGERSFRGSSHRSNVSNFAPSSPSSPLCLVFCCMTLNTSNWRDDPTGATVISKPVRVHFPLGVQWLLVPIRGA